jgi:DNA-binding transcriptional LysR family regulator
MKIRMARLNLPPQLDDPLLVKVGRGMEPSPAALKLIEQVHRILRDIERALRARMDKSKRPSVS